MRDTILFVLAILVSVLLFAGAVEAVQKLHWDSSDYLVMALTLLLLGAVIKE